MTTATTMKFEKRNFMGIELDVLVGHPEHELLFVGTQVARAAGLKDPATSVTKARVRRKIGHQLQEVFNGREIEQWPILPMVGPKGQSLRKDAVVLTEPETYAMLIHSRAPQTEPFRKWVTEEVLPTIRKTGRYNAEESSNPIAVSIMDELKTLRGEVVELKSMIQALTAQPFSLQAPPSATPSPYEGTPKVTVNDPGCFFPASFQRQYEVFGFTRTDGEKLGYSMKRDLEEHLRSIEAIVTKTSAFLQIGAPI